MTIYSYAPEAQQFKDESISISKRVMDYSRLIDSPLDTYDAVKLGAPYAKFPPGTDPDVRAKALLWALEEFGTEHVMSDMLGSTYVLFSTWNQAMMFKLRWAP